MKSKDTPLADFNVDALQKDLKEMKIQIKEAIDTSEDYSGEADLLMCVMENIEKEITGIENIKELEKHKQARVLADMALFNTMLTQMFGEEEDMEFDGEENFEEEEEDTVK